MQIEGVEVRNLRKVSRKGTSTGYSFEFEALVNGRWKRFGPQCYGNWTMAAEGFGHVKIGWWALDRAFRG